jgi:hypothetical protein
VCFAGLLAVEDETETREATITATLAIRISIAKLLLIFYGASLHAIRRCMGYIRPQPIRQENITTARYNPIDWQMISGSERITARMEAIHFCLKNAALDD